MRSSLSGSPAIPAPAATRTAPGAGRRRVGELHPELPAVELATVELLDRGLRGLRARHLDEAEAAGLPRCAVGDDAGRLHALNLRAELAKALGGRRERETADEQ